MKRTGTRISSSASFEAFARLSSLATVNDAEIAEFDFAALWRFEIITDKCDPVVVSPEILSLAGRREGVLYSSVDSTFTNAEE